MQAQPPEPVARPAFARWIFDRDLTLHQVATEIGCSAEQVRRYCLPFDHANRRIPDVRRMAAIVRFTAGEITAESFYPPEARGHGGQDEVRP